MAGTKTEVVWFLCFALCGAPLGADTLEDVRERGHLRCDITNHAPPFTMINDDGERTGFDIDNCNTVSAAVLGRVHVEFVPLTAHTAFTTLASAGSTCSAAEPPGP